MTSRSHALFRHARSEALIAFWRAEFLAHEIKVEQPDPASLVARAEGVRIALACHGPHCCLEVDCDDPAWLPEIRGHLDAHMAEFDPGMAPLIWSGRGQPGALPDALTLARVEACDPLGVSWWRMVLRLPAGAASRHAGAHWHFRLLRGAIPGRAPVWPRMNERGSIDWPSGADALLDRFFTTRHLDVASGLLSFDIFRHPGGPTDGWAATIPLCDEVGLFGPSGKAGPPWVAGRTLLAGGDETAIPAILRAMETAPAGAQGRAVLLAGSPEDRQDAPHPALRTHWLFRSQGATEADLIAALKEELRDAFDGLWFAGSQEAARRLRSSARAAGLTPDRASAIAYWS
ncbi:siderophore-interacting protein [Paracoccus sp. NSM]|uniref:siderophore-interacting protein n=1 Tax=Paracoccus sp. NSM TaxID=3457784 RepID=UPI00403732CE